MMKNSIYLVLLLGSICFASQPVFMTDSANNEISWTVFTRDVRYADKVSTHTAGKITATGNIPDVNFNVKSISYYSVGGETTITGIGGTTYIPSNTAISQDFEIGFSTPTLTVTLSAGTTLYYDIIGVK